MPSRLAPLAAGDLHLEPLAAVHAEAMFEVLCDPGLFRFIDDAPPRSVAALRERYARLELRVSPDGRQQWLNWVLRPRGAAPVGFVQATVDTDGQAWIAYLLASKHEGRGLAGRAVAAMLAHLETAYGVRRFVARIEAENERSLRLVERLGFGAAPPDEHPRHGLAPGERLFARDALSPPASP